MKALFHAKEVREAYQLGRQGVHYYELQAWLRQRANVCGEE